MRELAEGGSISRTPNEERRGEYEISAPAPPAQSGGPARKRAEDEPTLPISPLYRYCVAPAPAHSSLRSPNRDHHVRNHRDTVAPIADGPQRMLAGMAALALSFVFMHEGSGLAA
jgi:hypothetical protein